MEINKGVSDTEDRLEENCSITLRKQLHQFRVIQTDNLSDVSEAITHVTEMTGKNI